MRYIIKDITSGEYLRNGAMYFEWTSDIYYAKVFKGIKGATNTLNDIKKSRWECPSKHEYKIFGIEMKEIEV